MFYLASKIQGLPLVSLTTGQMLGKILDFIHEEGNGKVLAFLVKKGSFFSSPKIISSLDIIEISPAFGIVSKDEALVSLEEIVRAKENWSKKIKILKNKVIDENSKYLGNVFDFMFLYPSFSLEKIYIKPSRFGALFSGELVVPAKNILKITPKAIIIQGDFFTYSKAKEGEFVFPG